MGPFISKIPQPADLPANIKPGTNEMAWIVHHSAACGSK